MIWLCKDQACVAYREADQLKLLCSLSVPDSLLKIRLLELPPGHFLDHTMCLVQVNTLRRAVDGLSFPALLSAVRACWPLHH